MIERVNDHIRRIGGKDYLMVAGRVILAHEDTDNISIETEIVPEASSIENKNGKFFGFVTVKATVTTPKGIFTGYSMAYSGAPGAEGDATIEVAETSAIGRALGFAGYGTDYGIASAEEMFKVGKGTNAPAPVSEPTTSTRASTTRSTTMRQTPTQTQTAPQAQAESGDGEAIDPGRKRAIESIARTLNRRNKDFDLGAFLTENFGKSDVGELTVEEAKKAIEMFNGLLNG